MFKRLLPGHIDNTFRGSRLALWFLALLVRMKAAMGLNSVLNGRVVASSADGIPLDTFTPDGAQAVVSLFAIWGLSQLFFSLLGLLVLVRYRAMVPLMFALLLSEHLSRKLILHIMPIVKVGTPPGTAVNLVLLGLMVAGLALSLWTRSGGRAGK